MDVYIELDLLEEVDSYRNQDAAAGKSDYPRQLALVLLMESAYKKFQYVPPFQELSNAMLALVVSGRREYRGELQ